MLLASRLATRLIRSRLANRQSGRRTAAAAAAAAHHHKHHHLLLLLPAGALSSPSPPLTCKPQQRGFCATTAVKMAIAVRPKRFFLSVCFASSLVDEHIICKGSIRFGGLFNLLLTWLRRGYVCVGIGGRSDMLDLVDDTQPGPVRQAGEQGR